MMSRWMLLLFLLVSPSCTDQPSGSPEDDGGLRDAASHDAAVSDAAADLDAAEARSADFLVVNMTARPLYLQTSGFEGQIYWEIGRSGQRGTVRRGCSTCGCGETSCGVCGRALARVTKVEPGGTHEFSWDGLLWNERRDLQVSATGMPIPCMLAEAVSAGATSVHVTYSFSFTEDRSFGADDELIGPPLMVNLPFTHPPGAPVQIVVR
jgi:hypothetical protein